ncbi:hypothetical protein NPIL_544431, partial [Nephila pilipes]
MQPVESLLKENKLECLPRFRGGADGQLDAKT